MSLKSIFICLFTTLLFNAPLLKGQSEQESRNTDSPQFMYILTNSGMSAIYISDGEKAMPGVKGSHYVVEAFQPGTLVFDDTISINSGSYRLNTISNQMEIARDDDTSAISRPDRVNYIDFGGQRYIFYVINDNGTPRKVWLEELINDKSKLYRFYYYYIEKEFHRKAMDVGTGEKRIVQASKFFFQTADNQPMEMPKYRKKASVLFSGHEKEILDFMKKNNLKPNNKEDLILIVQHYNSLLD